MRNRFKITLAIITILILIIIALLISLNFQTPENKQNYKNIDSIPAFGYTLKSRDTSLMQEKFKELKDILNNDEIDYELYAKLLSELFIIDLYTLDNKDNKYDVGSLEYVYKEVVDNYKLKVEDTLYKYIVDKNNEERENLPIVKSILNSEVEKTSYTYNETEYEAYLIDITWDYEKDLGYDNLGEITLIKDDNKLWVVSYMGVDE